MGDLLKFIDREAAALPPCRQALIRNHAERAAIEDKIGKLSAIRAKLGDDLLAYDRTERMREERIEQEAESLVDRLRDNLSTALSAFGARVQTIDERLAVSRAQAEIGAKAIIAVDAEIEGLEASLAQLKSDEAALIKAALIESADSINTDLGTAIDNLKEALAMSAALARCVAEPRHDHVPLSRIVVELPPLVWQDSIADRAIVVPEGAIRKAASILFAFSKELERDARAPFPEEFPPVSASPPDDLTYDQLSRPERLQIDRQRAGL
jgi:hypothetical protein